MMVVVPLMTAVMILVYDSVPLTPGKEITIDREGDESHGQGEGEAPSEEEATGLGLHSPRYREHDQAVHDLHYGN